MLFRSPAAEAAPEVTVEATAPVAEATAAPETSAEPAAPSAEENA